MASAAVSKSSSQKKKYSLLNTSECLKNIITKTKKINLYDNVDLKSIKRKIVQDVQNPDNTESTLRCGDVANAKILINSCREDDIFQRTDIQLNPVHPERIILPNGPPFRLSECFEIPFKINRPIEIVSFVNDEDKTLLLHTHRNFRDRSISPVYGDDSDFSDSNDNVLEDSSKEDERKSDKFLKRSWLPSSRHSSPDSYVPEKSSRKTISQNVVLYDERNTPGPSGEHSKIGATRNYRRKRTKLDKNKYDKFERNERSSSSSSSTSSSSSSSSSSTSSSTDSSSLNKSRRSFKKAGPSRHYKRSETPEEKTPYYSDPVREKERLQQKRASYSRYDDSKRKRYNRDFHDKDVCRKPNHCSRSRPNRNVHSTQRRSQREYTGPPEPSVRMPMIANMPPPYPVPIYFNQPMIMAPPPFPMHFAPAQIYPPHFPYRSNVPFRPPHRFQQRSRLPMVRPRPFSPHHRPPPRFW